MGSCIMRTVFSRKRFWLFSVAASMNEQCLEAGGSNLRKEADQRVQSGLLVVFMMDRSADLLKVGYTILAGLGILKNLLNSFGKRLILDRYFLGWR